MSRRATWDGDVLDAREVEKLIRIYADEEARLISLISRAITAGRPTHTYTSFLHQVKREMSRLTGRAYPAATSLVKGSYELGKREADRLLKQMGEHAQDAFAYGQIHREAVNLLVQNVTNRLDDIAQVIGRRVSDTYRAIALESLRSQIIGTEAWKSASERYRDDLARHGITGFTDKLGRRWNMTAYVQMVARTTPMEAHLQGTCNRLLENGIDLVRVSDHVDPCEKCAAWEGKVLSITGRTPGYPTIAEARAQGLFHPNCRHATSGYLAPYLEEAEKEKPKERKPRAKKPIIPENPVGVVVDWDTVFANAGPRGAKAIKEAYLKADDLVLKVLNATGGLLRWSSANKRQSFYQMIGKLINLKNGFNLKRKRTLGTIRHEMGHFLDNQAGMKIARVWLSEDPRTRAAIDAAASRIRLDADFFDKLKIKHFPNYDVDVHEKTALPGGDFDILPAIGDIFDGITKRRDPPFGWGHGQAYWRRPGADQHEIFANVFDLMTCGNPKGLKVLEDSIPEVLKAFQEVINEALESLK